MGWEFEVLELISKRPKDIGTKRSWDNNLLGQNVVGTFGFWYNSLFLGQICIGTIYLRAENVWDNSPRDKRYWENPQGTISLGLFTVHH